MSQETSVMSFRKRLKKRGYSEISIIRKKDKYGKKISVHGFSLYTVTACEPLTGFKVSGDFLSVDLHNKMR